VAHSQACVVNGIKQANNQTNLSQARSKQAGPGVSIKLRHQSRLAT